MNAEAVLQMCRSSGVDVYWDGGETLQVFGNIKPGLRSLIHVYKPAIIAYYKELEFWSYPIVMELMRQARQNNRRLRG